MTLFKISLLNAVAFLVKMLTSLVLNKVLAMYVGPIGYAVIGQFQNATSLIVSLGGGLVSTGVTKLTAQHFDDLSKQYAVWRTAIRISLIFSIITAVPLVLLRDVLSQLLLNHDDMSNVFIYLAISLPALTINSILLAIVNGKRKIKTLVFSNISGSVISLISTGLLSFSYGLYGAIVAFIINPALVLIATWMLVTKQNWFSFPNYWGKIDKLILNELSGFALINATSAIAMPMTFILIRSIITSQLGVVYAGYWQASWKISELFLMLVSTTLSTYYLPRIAEIRVASDLVNEIKKVMRFTVPLVGLGAVTIYAFREFLVRKLFTSDFLPVTDLFMWQLTGDVVKIISWIFGYVLIGRAMVKFAVLTEITFSLLYVTLTYAFVSTFGLQGVAIAYTINYALHGLCMFYIVNIEVRKMAIIK